MKTAFVTILAGTLALVSIGRAQEAQYQYMAVCVDGDGGLTAWLDSRDEANAAGKEHERSTKGHRWDVRERKKPGNVDAIQPAAAHSTQTECFRFYSIGSTSKTGLRNTCDACKVAVIAFNYANGRHEDKEFRVAGKSSLEIDITGTQTTQIIDQKNCQ